MITRSFGKLSDGRRAGLYILRNRNGMEVHLTDYGAAIVSIIVPGRDGKRRDVVLGYDDVVGYENGGASIGATVGRVANRISNAAFDLNGRHYILTANNGPNCLHGGRDFYVQRLWKAVIPFGKVSTGDIAATYATESMNDWSRERRGRDAGMTNAVSMETNISVADAAAGSDSVTADAPKSGFEVRHASGDSMTFTLDSPDGDQGFPGDIHIELTYTLTDDNELHLDYEAAFNEKGKPALPGQAENNAADEESKAALETPLNLTNHSYFNLNGHDSGTVLTQEVWIDADYFTEADRRSIPTGTLLEVKWTPMDFRKPKELGKDINADYEQLRFGGGYDHNFVLGSGQSDCREVASMYAKDSGIRMTVATDLPGIQLYTANGLDNEMGKDDAVYGKRSAACFETQFWPDTINKENFPGCILREGEEFRSRTTYAFSVEEAE